MRRNRFFRLFVMLIVTSNLFMCSCSEPVLRDDTDFLSGYWEGIIHPACNYTMILYFYSEHGEQSGKYYVFQHNTPIQNSNVRDVRISAGKLFFYIDGINTPFEGEIDSSNKLISGNFYFPGGDSEPVIVRKVDNPPRNLPVDPTSHYLNPSDTELEQKHPR